MIERKKTITLGLPRVSESEARNARQPREAGGGADAEASGRSRHLPREIKQIGGAGELDRDEHASEGLGDDRETRRGQHEPDHVGDEIAGDEWRDALEPLSQHARDERRHARSRRRDRNEIDGGENDERG